MEMQKFKHTELNLKGRTDFYHPKADMITFFIHDFEANESSKADERAISMDFEGFRRLKTLQLRYESFGYCKMFRRMLEIEDLTIRKALHELSMNDKMIASTSFHHHFQVSFGDKKLSDKLGFNHLVLTPMSKFDPQSTLETDRIFNKIIKIDGSRVVFEKPRSRILDNSVPYRVELVENRMSTRLAHQAFEKIHKFNLEEFFTTFDERKLKSVDRKILIPENKIDAVNPNVGSNKSQMEAVKNIVNQSSFPSPYVIFGPPGDSLAKSSPMF
jgi:hypothetical protein